jgi:hypothetical protein
VLAALEFIGEGSDVHQELLGGGVDCALAVLERRTPSCYIPTASETALAAALPSG